MTLMLGYKHSGIRAFCTAYVKDAVNSEIGGCDEGNLERGMMGSTIEEWHERGRGETEGERYVGLVRVKNC